MRSSLQTNQQQSSGFVLISILLTTMFVLVAGAATAQLATNNYRASTVEHYRVNTQFTADAGIDSAIREINADHDWSGTSGEVNFYNTSALRTTYQTAVINDSDPLIKNITVTARAYAPSSGTTPQIERTYTVKLRGISAGNYSVVTGVGGLEMLNNSRVIGGNLFVNGTIKMRNYATIGLSTAPIEVRVAHQSCPIPANATYPRVCNFGENGQPIDMDSSSTPEIYGEVIANNQTDGSDMSMPGLVAGSVTPQALPTHDRAAQVAAVATTQDADDAECSGGTKTWPANLRITGGDITITGDCRLTVMGDVWVDGEVTISGTAQLIVANGLTTPPVIMVDGEDGFKASNSAILVGNSSSIGFRIISYWSNTACSPNCANVTGADLYNSATHTTIQISNSATGQTTEVFARWSQAQLSNTGNIGAVVGQTVKLTNTATVTFGTTVSGSSGVVGWVIDSYKRNY